MLDCESTISTCGVQSLNHTQLQEIIVSDKVTILHGTERTSWERVNLLRNLSHNDRLPTNCHDAMCSYSVRVKPTNTWYSDFRAGKRMPMHEALLLTHYRQSGEESDKVFSLLGLVDACGIEPDCTMDPASVYRRTVQEIIEQEQSLEILSAVCELRNEFLFEKIEESSRRCRELRSTSDTETPGSVETRRQDLGILKPLQDSVMSSWDPGTESTSESIPLSSWPFQPGYQHNIKKPIYTEVETRPQDRIIPFGATGNSKPDVKFTGAVTELRGIVLSRILPNPYGEAPSTGVQYLSSERSEVQMPEQFKRLEEVCHPLWYGYIEQGGTLDHEAKSWRLETLRAFQQTLILGADADGAKYYGPSFSNPFLDHLFAWTGLRTSYADSGPCDSGPLHAITHLMFQRTLNTRSFFVTASGYMGFASMEVAAGDVANDLCADVQGMMEGEAWPGLGDGEGSLQTIRII